MQDVTETSEEVLWTLGFAAVTGTLLFALFAGTSRAATMLASWSGTFRRVAVRLVVRRRPV